MLREKRKTKGKMRKKGGAGSGGGRGVWRKGTRKEWEERGIVERGVTSQGGRIFHKEAAAAVFLPSPNTEPAAL